MSSPGLGRPVRHLGARGRGRRHGAVTRPSRKATASRHTAHAPTRSPTTQRGRATVVDAGRTVVPYVNRTLTSLLTPGSSMVTP